MSDPAERAARLIAKLEGDWSEVNIKWAANIIRAEYAIYLEAYPSPQSLQICRHCGQDLALLHAEANIWPHMTGYCKEAQPAPKAR